PYAVAIVDLDLDGRPDVLAAHDDSDDVTLLLGRDGGRLAPAPWSPFTMGGRVFRMEAGDLDGDGRIDLVAGAGDRLLLLMGATRRAQLAPTGQSWSVALGDLDRDGAIDVIAPDARADRLRLWLSR